MSKNTLNNISIAILVSIVVAIIISVVVFINKTPETSSFPTTFVVLQLFILSCSVFLAIKSIKNNNENDVFQMDLINDSDDKNVDSNNNHLQKQIISNSDIFSDKVIDDINNRADDILRRFAKKLDLACGVFYLLSDNKFSAVADYALISETAVEPFVLGETIPGQVAKNQKILKVNVGFEDPLKTNSGLGSGKPNEILFIPIINKNNCTIGILEIATFKNFDNLEFDNLEALGKSIADYIEQ